MTSHPCARSYKQRSQKGMIRMESTIQKGRLLILAIIVILVVTSLLSTTITVLTFGPDRLWRDAVRLLLTALLCFLLYQGRTWTRWLLALLVGLGGLLGLLGALAVLRLNVGIAILLFGIAIAY